MVPFDHPRCARARSQSGRSRLLSGARATRRGRAEDLHLLGARDIVELLLGVELARVLLDDVQVARLGVGALQELELAAVGVLVGRVAVRLVPPSPAAWLPVPVLLGDLALRSLAPRPSVSPTSKLLSTADA